MGQFKPMVKMETTEPSVILKLKKGGHVAPLHKDADGHTNMKGDSFKAKYSEEACEGDAPKKPSMSDRRKAMSGALLNSKKGGKAVKKANGGMMGAPAMAAPAMAAPAAAPMDPRKAAMMRAMRGRRGAPAVPMSAPAAPMGMPARKKGGKAKHEDAAEDRAMIKKAMAGKKFAAGGTIEGNEKAFKNTKVVDGDKTDKAHGTGAVKMGKPAGYKTGGVIEGKPAGYKKGGNVNWENRPANTGDRFDPAHGTGEVRESNAGGYKKGGAAKKHFATGGAVETGRAVAMPRKPVSKPVSNTNQSGTFKKGGKVGSDLVDASKGAYDKAIGPSEDDMSTAAAFRDPVGSMKKLLGMGSESEAGAGRGLVNPPLARKQGGRAKR